MLGLPPARSVLLTAISVVVVVVTEVESRASEVVAAELTEVAVQQDVMFLAPGGPVIIRIRCRLDAAEVDQSRRSLAATLVTLLDANHDGTLGADEAARLPAYGRFGEARRVKDEWRRLDTAPPDDAVSVDEFLAHIASVTPVSLVLSPGVSVRSLALDLQQRLDANGDGLLVPVELRQARDLLRACDLDDDGTFSLVELEALSQAATVDSTSTNPAAALLPFIVVEPASHEDLCDLLVTWYSTSVVSSSRAVEAALPAGSLLDADGDGRITHDEVRRLLDNYEPDYRLDVRFGERVRRLIEWTRVSRAGATAPPSEPLTLTRRVDPLEVSAGGAGIVLKWQKAAVVMPLLRDSLRSRFEVAERNRNSYIEAAEFPALDLPGREFVDVDFDGNGEIVKAEFEAFIEQELMFSEARVTAEVDNPRKSLFERLDDDEDRRLSPRELLNAAEEANPLNRGAASNTEPETERGHYALTFRQGIAKLSSTPIRPESGFDRSRSAQKPVITAPKEGPLWFRKMDRNQDGDVTWREFLGPSKSFARLDANGDTLIDADEAVNAAPEAQTGD